MISPAAIVHLTLVPTPARLSVSIHQLDTNHSTNESERRINWWASYSTVMEQEEEEEEQDTNRGGEHFSQPATMAIPRIIHKTPLHM